MQKDAVFTIPSLFIERKGPISEWQSQYAALYAAIAVTGACVAVPGTVMTVLGAAIRTGPACGPKPTRRPVATAWQLH